MVYEYIGWFASDKFDTLAAWTQKGLVEATDEHIAFSLAEDDLKKRIGEDMKTLLNWYVRPKQENS